ncbi:MAG: flagellar hook protein FlgE [Polyangiaceae bacterium]|jgi:flagellar hook protein FlgE
MSILNAMYTGVSGLDAESTDLNIIGNNISNANTIGFKESRAAFDNVMGAVDPTVVGDGVEIGGTQQVFTQGSLLNTGVQSDLAISGDGFFVVSGSVGGITGNFYERDGQTSINANGQLVDTNGLPMQGYAIDQTGKASSTLSAITLPTAALAPKATSTITVAANLNSGATTTDAPFTDSIPTYNSQGTSQQVGLSFQNTGPGTWTCTATVPGAGSTPVTVGTGSLTFANGQLSNASPITLTIPGTGTGASQTVKLNFTGTTQFASTSAVSSQTQDGYASGSMSGVQVGQDGTVSGVYSNGQTVAVGQLAIAKFPSNTGLTCAGNNLWAASQGSGAPSLGAAGTGGRGSISSGSLEQSNVDITAQFVDLIAQQRAFEADSKTITTADQMMQDLMQMKQ